MHYKQGNRKENITQWRISKIKNEIDILKKDKSKLKEKQFNECMKEVQQNKQANIYLAMSLTLNLLILWIIFR